MNSFRKYILLTILFPVAFSVNADVFDDIAKAISSGNAAQVTKFFSSSVEMQLGSNEGMYSKSQAERILQDFFTKNPAKSFTITHRGAKSNNASYIIGNYQSANGNYRVTIYTKESGGNAWVHEIKFEKS